MQAKKPFNPLIDTSFEYLFKIKHKWETSTAIKLGDSTYDIIRHRVHPEKEEYAYYIIESDKPLRNDKMGALYQAYAIDPTTFKVDLKKPLVAKIFPTFLNTLRRNLSFLNEKKEDTLNLFFQNVASLEESDRTTFLYDCGKYTIIAQAIHALDERNLSTQEFTSTPYTKMDEIKAKIIVSFDGEGLLNAEALKKINLYTHTQLTTLECLIDNKLMANFEINNFSENTAEAILNLHRHKMLTQDNVMLVYQADFAQKINQLNQGNWKKLTQLIKVGKDFGFPINLSALKTIVTNKGISATEVLKATLQAYKTHRENDERGNYFSFWARLGGFSGKTKIHAVDEMLASLDDRSKTISPQSQKALKDGRLGKIMTAFKDYVETEQAELAQEKPGKQEAP